ncbi:lipoprotein lppD [Mycobacterium tuberculosis T17]|nr:lipoprotein lppD [Mycobacterium tuberculosis T17]
MLFAPSVQLDHEPSVCVLASRLIVLVHLKLPRIWARWAGVSMGRSGAGRGFDCVGDGGDGPTQQGVHHRGRRVLAGGDNVSMIELEVHQADVTKLELDAITNAANTRLRHAGGVAAAIARAGGPELQRESTEKAPIGLGEAVETTAGDMPARYVIHAATMELGGPTSGEIITAATAATLRKADELGCRSLALVAFGTGVGGFPLDDAARLMVGAVRRHRPGSLQRVVFAVHGDAAERAFSAAIQAGEDTARR